MQKAYGGVVINVRSEVLIREPRGHYDGYVWTFAKGMPKKGESPEQTAVRKVKTETGIAAEILVRVPGSFRGSTTDNEYFLMRPLQDTGNFGNQTQAVRWVTQREAEALIKETENAVGRERDRRLLNEALATWNDSYDERGRALRTATRKDWKVKRMPTRRAQLLFDRTFSSAEMDLIKRGFIPKEMGQYWFIFFERNRVYIHRSWSGICIYIVQIEKRDECWAVTKAEVNRNRSQYKETDDAYDVRMLLYLIDGALLERKVSFPQKAP